MHANALALGRNHSTADVASLTEFGGTDPCFRVDLKWNDGGHFYEIHDTKGEAVAHLNRLGFYA